MAEAQAPEARLEALEADPEFHSALFDAAHPAHSQAVLDWSQAQHAVTGEDAPEPAAAPRADVADIVPLAAQAALNAGPPQSASDYAIADRILGPAERANPETMATVEKAQGEAFAAGLPVDLVRSIGLALSAVKSPPGDTERASTAAASRTALREEFGDRFEALAAKTDDWIETMPVVAQLLRDSGLGDNEGVVRRLMLHVQSKGETL